MVKEIELTKGQVAIVDDEYYDYLNQFKWHFSPCGKGVKDGYAYTHGMIKGKHVSMHRELYKLHFKLKSEDIKNLEIDHINKNKLDNQIENLRLVSSKQNKANRNADKGNKTGYKGVRLFRNGRYTARVYHEGKEIHLGYYITAEEAALAYNLKAKELWGDYASLNKVDSDIKLIRLGSGRLKN